MIDIHQIRNKYQHHTTHLGRARRNGEVIGIEVDEKNKIHYVIRRDNQIVVEDFKTAKPSLISISSGNKIIVKT